MSAVEPKAPPKPPAVPPVAAKPPSAKRRGRAGDVLVRSLVSLGIVGVATAIAAILGTQEVAHWVTGLVVSLLSLALFAITLAVTRTS